MFKKQHILFISCIVLASCSNESIPEGDWFVTFPSTSIDIRIATPTTISAQIDAKGASLTEKWKLQSKTADVDCGFLIQEQTATSITLTIPGDTDPRCADELTLTLTLTEDGTRQTETPLTLSVIPTPDRITSFTEQAGNPQPDIQTCPAWDCLNHSDPTLGRLPSGELAIWFAAGGDRSTEKPVVGRAVQHQEIWELDTDPVMLPTDAEAEAWDTVRETPSVRWNATANAWDMWYLGYNISFFDDPAIGQAQSLDADGMKWPRPSAPIYRPKADQWDENFLTSPGAVLGSDGTWRLYYTGASFARNSGLMSVGVLTSKDGETWEPHANNPVFEGTANQWDASIIDPHVQFIGGRYVMWYSALAGQLQNNTPISVGVATSEDGFTWKRVQQTPVIAPTVNTWTDFRVLDVEVFPQANGSLLMVGYATSNIAPNPSFPDFKPGRIGFWVSH
ncbi:MAG: hypothetical protein L3K25_13815 [Gammaproteobacteria bacterium]|nr:hypothetical protein [Gammaproteobacteria bacterium]